MAGFEVFGRGRFWMFGDTSLMVPEQHLTRIQGLNQLLQGGINIVAAPLGALLLALFPMGGVMLVDVGTALLAIVPLLFIRVPQPAVATGDANGAEVSLWGEMLAGFRYLAERRGHLILIFMAALINMCLVPAFSLLPLLVSAQFDGNALQLGWMSTGFGIGTIVGGILLGVWGGFKRRVLTSLLALIGLGLSVVALGLAPGYALALTAMILVGLTAPFANGPISAILQATIAAEYQGRVFTLVGSLAAATAPLGLLLAAPVAELVGVRAWYVTGGLVCLAMGAVGFLLPPLLTIEGTRAEAQESDQAALRA